jgi:hypothetical protein
MRELRKQETNILEPLNRLALRSLQQLSLALRYPPVQLKTQAVLVSGIKQVSLFAPPPFEVLRHSRRCRPFGLQVSSDCLDAFRYS